MRQRHKILEYARQQNVAENPWRQIAICYGGFFALTIALYVLMLISDDFALVARHRAVLTISAALLGGGYTYLIVHSSIRLKGDGQRLRVGLIAALFLACTSCAFMAGWMVLVFLHGD